MNPNTKVRVTSAIIMITLLILCLFLGPKVSLGAIFVIGILVHDEIYCNFLKRDRFSLPYLISLSLFVLPFIFLNFYDPAPHFRTLLANLALVLNFFLLIYLFLTPMETNIPQNISKYLPFSISLFVLIPFQSFASIFHHGLWLQLIITLLGITIAMDSGAWFFGKRFGKNKLWPSVSPNKTVEGLIAGVICSGLVGSLFSHLLLEHLNFALFLIYCLLGLLSQLGDLVQSKIKRQFNIKDSSSLIPGHGGVYDRIDSLMFVAPFFWSAIYFI